MYYVYIIKSENNRYYTGSTEEISKRLKQHNRKELKCWTNRYDNWSLVYYEEYSSRTEALKREREIKSYKGGRAFKKLVEGS